MQKLLRKMCSKKGFTLVELMIVVVIVAILALVAIPLYRGNLTAAKMSEGVSGVGTIRTALRVYAAAHGGIYPVGAAITDSAVGIKSDDLEGKYFKFSRSDYNLNVSSTTGYTIRATLAASEGGGATDFYEIDQDGKENASGFTTQ